jgi:hypothetical protein
MAVLMMALVTPVQIMAGHESGIVAGEPPAGEGRRARRLVDDTHAATHRADRLAG